MIESSIMLFLFGDFTPRNVILWVAVLGGMSILYMVFMPQLMGLQSRLAVRQAKQSVEKLKDWSDDSKNTALKKIAKHGRTRRDVEEEFEDFREFFAIQPVSEDPRGVLDRLEHLLDVRKKRFESAVERFAPEAEEDEAADIEMTIEGAIANYTIYKIVNHFVNIAEKTNSMQLAQLLQMQMPMLEKIAESYHTATKAFAEGKVIGDGIGPMIATQFIGEESTEEEIKDTVYTKADIEGRRAYIIKAKGPGGRVGKPGELIKKLAQNRKLDRIFMIDAGLKLEGEESGKIVEGVGAAIGGPPTEKHKIEKLSTRRNIPLDAIVIKESLKEAITPMSETLSESVDSAVEKVKKAIINRTDKGDAVFIAGIGNTIGVGQNPEDLPTEFPKVEKKEDELESFMPLPGMGGASKLKDDVTPNSIKQ